MADALAPAAFDDAAPVARVLRSNAETEQFVAEPRKLIDEQTELQAGAATLPAETLKRGRDQVLAALSVGYAGMAAAAAFIGAGAAFVRLLSP